MDSVRFGRALGFGARSAARALATAVDAATAPNPTTPKSAPTPQRSTSTPPAAAPPSQTTQRTASQPEPQVAPPRPLIQSAARAAFQTQAKARQASAGVAAGSRNFGRSVWRPFVKLSGVLWLELTGSFFAIIAFFTGQSLWGHRADFHPNPANPTAQQHFFVYLAVTLMFGWFAVTSFLKARRRNRAQ